jgi:formate dehydrogenase alpha subunit
MAETFLLDGREIEFNPGETVLEAARRHGVAIPTLCYDPRLEAAGACRLCLVRIESRSAPAAACVLPAEPGIEVSLESEELRTYRRTLLEMVLSENPGEECTRCAELGPCELHALADAHGALAGRFRGATSGEVRAADNPFIDRDYSRCIYCYRCTRVCGEVEMASAIVPAGRGFQTRIATTLDGGLKASPCTFCGQCVQTCPTGALSDRKMLGQARVEEVARVPTVCSFCGTGCGIELHVARGRVIGVTPDAAAPANEGALCVKGQFAWDFIHSPERLTTPLIKVDGRLREAGWDEALDLVAYRLQEIKDRHGADSLCFWSSARAVSEANYLFQKLARAAIGTNSVDNCART